MDPATITAAIGAVTAGVGLIDKIGDQITRFLANREANVTPSNHRAKIEREGDAVVQKHNGVELQCVTASELEQRLSESDFKHIKVREKSMENYYQIWASVYPQLALASDPIAKARTEQQLHQIIRDMKADLVGILDFLQKGGVHLDDHYMHIRDVVDRA